MTYKYRASKGAQCTYSAMKSLQSNPHPRMAGVVVGGGGNNPELRHSKKLELAALLYNSLQFILGARPILTRLIKIGDVKLFYWSCGKNL